MPQTIGIRREKVVADQLNMFSKFVRQRPPSFPIVFLEAVFDRGDGIVRLPVRQHFDHPGSREYPIFAVEAIAAIGIEVGGCDIERNREVVFQARPRDTVSKDIQRFGVRLSAGPSLLRRQRQ